MLVLGIESSCDETAAAIVEDGRIRSSLVATQHDVHERFGGVVPELASRRHLENIVPLIRGALADAGVCLSDVEGVAATSAPGLLGALLVGISAAKGIAYARAVPFVGVNHLEGHLNAAALEFGEIPLPHVGLVVSGGHTSLYLVRGFGDYRLLGATRDDAAGEAFDKVAKLLELGYPGGPAIERAAQGGDPKAFRFTRPKFSADDSLDFSFSGIKTAVLLLHRKEFGPPSPQPSPRRGEGEEVSPSPFRGEGRVRGGFVADLAASFQEAAVGILVDRLLDAARRNSAHAAVLAGGVAANSRLREKLAERAAEDGIASFIPQARLCTDNAAMIAFVGERRLKAGQRDSLALNAVANQEIGA